METADAGCSPLHTFCIPQDSGTGMHISTNCCFFVVGQKDFSGNTDCQAPFPALAGEHVTEAHAVLL